MNIKKANMKMKTALTALVALASTIVLAADDTYSFTYQAALRDEHGSVISNGTAVARNQTVTLRLWDAPTGGNLLWGRTYNIYTDETGLFNLEVSDASGSAAPDAPEGATLEGVFARCPAGRVYVGLFVNGSSGEIVPRQRLFAVPFAAVANDVRQISGDITVGGIIRMSDGVVITKDGISQERGSSIFQDVTANGAVNVSGQIKSGGGLVVNGGEVTIEPAATFKLKLTVSGQAVLNGGATVSGGDLAVASGNTLTVGGEEVIPVPIGGIIMWTKSTLPDQTHWAVCNGQTVNGVTTPDLRGRFVVGANNGTTGKNGSFSTYDPGASDSTLKGGEERHALSIGEMPKHNHSYNFTGADLDSGWDGDNYFYNQSEKYSGNTNTKYTNYEGGGQSHENRPPYYSLYYIMRVR